MMPDLRIVDLLVRYEELLEDDLELGPEELCSDCPELLTEVKRRLESLRALQDAWDCEAPLDRSDPLATRVNTPHRETDAQQQRPGDAARSAYGSASPDRRVAASVCGFASARYEPLRFHAEGGLGEVHVARDCEVNREVALKRLQARHTHNEDCRRRFLREAEITARLEHPGIVPVYGVVQDADGQPCYAMRFVEGETLHHALRAFHRPGRRDENEPTDHEAETLAFGEQRVRKAAASPRSQDGGSFYSMEFRQLLQRFVTVCNTMAYAHSRKVVHRDLKPANIMLGKYGETLVVDWGLAKCLDPAAQAAGELETTDFAPEHAFASQVAQVDAEPGNFAPSDDSLTLAGQALGTPVYMSPEQAAGDWNRVGPASDIYSLGATLYTLLTGRAPIQERGWERIREQILAGDIPRPRQVRKDVPRSLEAVCLKAMSHRPEDRYGSALDLARDVEHWLADEPVTAWREPWRERLRRWARRHRPAVVSAAIAGILLFAGALLSGWLWETAERRRTRVAEEHAAQLRSDVEAADRLAQAEIAAGRFPSAEGILAQKLKLLHAEPEQQDLWTRLSARHGRVQALVRFYALSDSAERLVLHLSDQDAAHACQAGLDELRIFDHANPNWWDRLPVEDLPPELVAKLREDVYRQLLLLASFRAKEAFVRLLSPSAHPHYRAALEALAAAQRFRPSHAAKLAELMCQVGLGQIKDPQPLPPPSPTCATDYYFLGFIQYWVTPLVEQDWATGALVMTFKGLSGLDLDAPLATAERYLRMAAALEPEHYWAHAWLSNTLHLARNYAGAYLAANACVALRPNEATGIRLRARALLSLALDAKDPDRRADYLWRGLGDFDRALALAPYDVDSHFHALVLYKSLELWPEVVVAGARTFELMPPIEPDGSWDQVFRRNAVLKMLERFGEAAYPRSGDADYLSVIAHGYWLAEDDDRAFQLANRALAVDSNHVRALAVRGQVNLKRKEYEAALRDFDAALSQEFDNYLARSGRARVEEARGDLESALGDYAKLEQIAVTAWQSREALQGESRVLQRLGRNAEARQAREQSQGLLLAPPPLPPAKATAVPANAASPDFIPSDARLDRKYALVHAYRSLARERQQRSPEALEEWNKALRLAPDMPELFMHRGVFLRDAGQLERAIADFSAAIRLDPGNAFYYCLRANCYASQGRTPEALADFQAALGVHPGYVTAFLDRGQLHLKTKAFDRAVADFTEALRLYPPGRGEILGRRGAALRLRGELGRALEDLNAALKLLPKDVGLYNERALVYFARREYDRALADFNTALQLNPKQAAFLKNRADVHLQKGAAQLALRDLNDALALNSDCSEALALRSQVHAHLANWDAAIQDADKAVRLDGSRPEVWNLLALLHLRAGDQEAYRKVCAEMLKQLGQSDDPETSSFVAAIATWRPGGVSDPAALVPLAEEAVAAHPNQRTHLFRLALALYRAGRYEHARECLETSLKASRGGTYHDWFLLAMIERQRDRPEEARRWLQKAISVVDEKQKAKMLGVIERLEVELLRREAEELIPAR